MDTVILGVDGGGAVRRVFASKEVAERVLRGTGYHPHKNDNHKQHWYDANDHHRITLNGWDVVN